MVKADAKKQKVKVAAKKAAKKKGRKPVGKKDNSTSCDGPAVTLSDDWPMATEMPRIVPADSKLASTSSLVMKFKKDDSDQDDDEDFCFGGDHAETEPLTSDVAADKNKSSYEIEPPLAPGPCLHACSGSDVQLARGANTKPNLDKAKGKFLIILPGMMSFQHLTKSDTTKPPSIITQESTLTQETCLTQESSNMVEMTQDTVNSEEEMENGTTGNIEENSKSAKAEVATKSALPKLGKIENLGTDNPILKIPFDGESNTQNNNGRVLVFSGKKIESSSKFMMLTCKSSKQSVTCKDIYSSVIVFGEGKWEKKLDTDIQSDMVTSSKRVHEQPHLSVIAESAPPSPLEDTTQFHHYGGSNRAVDGGKAISSSRRKSRFVSHKRKSGEGAQVNLQKPVDPKKLDEEQRNGSDGESDDIEMLLGGEDEDDDEYVAPAITKSSQDSISRKQTPRRSAAKSKVNYTDSLNDSDSDKEDELSENENDDEDNSEISDQSNRPKRGRPARKSNASTAMKQPKNGDGVVEIDDDSERSPNARPTRAKPAAPKAKKVASTKKTPTKRGVVEIDDSEDDYVDENSEKGSSRRKTTASRKQTPRRSAAKSKVNYTDSPNDSDSDKEDELSENENDDEDNSEISDQSNRPKRGRPARKSNAPPAMRQPKNDDKVVEIDDDSERSPNARPTRAKPAAPKAKKVASTKKTPTKRGVVEIDDSEDDYVDESSKKGAARRKITPRRSVTKTKVNYTVAGSDDENDQDESAGEEEQNSDDDPSFSKKPRSTRKPASSKTTSSVRKKPAPRKSRAGSNTNKMNQVQGTKKARAPSKKYDEIDVVDDYAINGDASLEHDENSSPKDGNNANVRKVGSTRKALARTRQTKAPTKATNITAVKMGNTGKPLTSKNVVDDFSENQEVGVKVVSSPTETPKSKSSRRKRKSPGKALKSPTKKKLLVNDDEFSFLD